ncbi:MAG: CRISPR-associated helicase Cas3' [Acidobacteriota bacterium]|nr:CRISPR-associated helicase Cas3' [Acidobacteriota bacterium]
MRFPEFFKSLTGFFPFPYQERLADQLLQGKPVILRVPTGAGKTWAMVAPFLYSMATGRRLADRLLYALPRRSLASSLFATTQQQMRGVLERVVTTGKDRDYTSAATFCSLQIGGQKDDPFFESDLVFTTIDQLLSSYILLPVSLPNRLGNMNAGSLPGSLVVFDEIHLLDPSVALGTAIEMLHRLKGLCQFVLMTATMSDEAIAWLAEKLGAFVLPISDDEVRALPSQQNKRRAWAWNPEPISAIAIRPHHYGGRTIVLANSVKRAQNLFLDLADIFKNETNPPKLILLHSRFYPEHRKDIEKELPKYFGPKGTCTNVILVTTQVIEAGIDISADHLHTELTPMNALIQRAGRTARYESRNTGMVTVYELNGLGPYVEEKTLIDDTRRVLQELSTASENINFTQEQRWVEKVHKGVEGARLRRYANLISQRSAVHEAMDQGHRGKLSQLVRDIDSILRTPRTKTRKLVNRSADAQQSFLFERGRDPPFQSRLGLGCSLRPLSA